MMLLSLAAVLTLFLGATAAMLVGRWVDGALRHVPGSETQLIPFTGGHEPATHAWNRYHVRYYTMAVLFLASPRSRNITGQEIQVTAGQHIA